MQANKCQLCPVDITEVNDSKEHIIPNAIGGRKKIKGFICKDCNSRSGDDWDAALGAQLNFLCLFFEIGRERGKPPSMTVDTSVGPLKLHHDGTQSLIRPVYEVQQTDNGGTLNIQARSLKEAGHLIQRAKSELPNLDVQAARDSLKILDDVSPRIVKASLNFGGEESGRSLVKSCLALAWTAGIEASQCSPAMEYLKNGGEANFGFFYERDLILNRPIDSIFHCVAVVGDPESKMLLGYVEYFSAHRAVVCLSDQYIGKSFSKVYAIDPRTGTELDLRVELPFSATDMQAICNYEKIPDGAMLAAMEEVMRIGYTASMERQKTRVFEEAIAYGFANCGAKYGELLTEEQTRKLWLLIAEKLTPFFFQRITAINQETGNFSEALSSASIATRSSL